MFQVLLTFGNRSFTQLSCHSAHLEDSNIDVSVCL